MGPEPQAIDQRSDTLRSDTVGSVHALLAGEADHLDRCCSYSVGQPSPTDDQSCDTNCAANQPAPALPPGESSALPSPCRSLMDGKENQESAPPAKK